ncbi:MAG TPA: hypothetical protein VG894_06915 [Bauldia sp.]|nr:hypothetical protein [Bauldia sp.]
MKSIRIAVAAVVATTIGLGAAWAAVNHHGTKLTFAPGTKTTVQGMHLNTTGGNGISGSFDCSCQGKGTCTLTTNSTGALCYKGAGATCNGSCTMTTRTNGLSGVHLSPY